MMWLNADEMKTLGSVDEFVEFLDRRTRLPRIKADELDAAEFWKKNELEQRAMLLRELTSESDWNQYTSDRRMTANEHYAEMRAMRAFLDNVIEALRVPVSVS
jgi:hypothetical protein